MSKYLFSWVNGFILFAASVKTVVIEEYVEGDEVIEGKLFDMERPHTHVHIYYTYARPTHVPRDIVHVYKEPFLHIFKLHFIVISNR